MRYEAFWSLKKRKKNGFMPYVDNEGPDQTAHARSLIRTFVARLQAQWILCNTLTSVECCAQATVMVWASAFRMT